MTNALLILAQATENTAEADPGVDPFLIVGTVLAIVVALAVLATVFTRGSRRSRGGVEPPSSSQKAGEPPFEGIARDRDRERDPAA